MIFQERLRALRKERHETQTQVAAALGIVDRHYQKFEAGANLPSFSKLLALADYFQVNLDYLVGRTDVREMLPPSAALSSEVGASLGSLEKGAVSEAD